MQRSEVRPIAIHLPQFHPNPQNDEWWGKGFTEWTNTAKGRPLFKDHYQPHVPADLGFYDLRLPEARDAQARLAREYGIYGFCYYHYWFHGQRMLEKPVNEILRTQEPDFPFMLCWANGDWTRTWNGKNDDILMAQTYSREDDIAHIRYLMEIFKDKRYIRVDNKPVFAICRTEIMPDPKMTADIWREEIKKAGFDGIYLMRLEMFEAGYPPQKIGFDASVEFQPDWRNFPKPVRPLFGKLLHKLGLKRDVFSINQVYNYKDVVEKMLQKQPVTYTLFPGIMPGWDNSPRKKSGAIIMQDSNPGLFKYWVQQVLRRFKSYSAEENFLFINAWNEWAEGNHLEPCHRWGKGHLEALKEVLDEYNSSINTNAGQNKRDLSQVH